MTETLDRVKTVTAALLKIDVAEIVNDARFVEELGASSMQSIELVAAFEDEFDIDIDEQAALSVKTIADAAVFIDGVLDEE